jgi:ribosomal-protein-alanine N-acetyltransferase
MPELKRLHADHAPAVLAFEVANRAYFATSIPDRGDDFFDRFAERYEASLAEQDDGVCAFYVLVAEQVAGRGVATAAVRELCRTAPATHGLRTLRAATSHDNTASRKVLTKAGFVPVGPAAPADLGGTSGTWYQRDLQS